MTGEFLRKKLGSATGGWLIAEEALLKLAGAGCRWQRLAGDTTSLKLKEAVGQHLLKIPRKAGKAQIPQGGKREGCCQSGTWGETDLSSPSAAPYKQEARRRSGSERHPEPIARMPLAPAGGKTVQQAGNHQPMRLNGRQGERLSESSA